MNWIRKFVLFKIMRQKLSIDAAYRNEVYSIRSGTFEMQDWKVFGYLSFGRYTVECAGSDPIGWVLFLPEKNTVV